MNKRLILFILSFLICAFTSINVFAQTRITGIVTDEKGEPVIGANIVVKGVAGSGTVTDVDGKFSLNVSPGATLTVSYIGYVPKEITVGSKSVINVTLAENALGLEEVVVVGYGTQKKENLSGAVSSISGKSISERSVTNLNSALQGLAANMNIASSTGNPTASPGINIRGYTSINGGETLILVDNVPATSGELSRLNPADIESVSVLKDAASAAIYGGRAAFGVVLVTTRTAKDEKLKVSADATYSVRSFIELPEVLQDTYWFMWFANQTSGDPNRYDAKSLEYAKKRMADPSLPMIIDPKDGWNPRLTNAGRWDYYGNTNWADIIFHDSAPAQNYSLQISQKTDRLSYMLTGGYYQQNSLVNYEDPYTRYNFRGAATYKLTNRWNFGSKISYSRSDWSTPRMTDENNTQNVFYQYQSKYITGPVYNPDGSWTQDGGTAVGLMRDGGKTAVVTNEMQLTFDTQFDIVKDVWAIKGDISLKINNRQKHSSEIPVYYRGGPGLPLAVTWGTTLSKASIDNTDGNQTMINLYSDYHKTFAGKHFIQALAGFNQESYRNVNFGLTAENLITESYPTAQLTSGATTKYENIGTYALRGAFARLNYIFDSKYIFEFNGRYDGTSRFPKNNRFGFFPSASVGWVLSQEKFFRPVADALKISMLKFRGSYGSLGNQQVSYYPYIATMGVTSQINRVIEGERPMAIGAPGVVAGDLTWETVRTVNGGIDLVLFNNRFELTLDKYTRYTENMLTRSKTLPAIFGASEPNTNAANLKTKGFEITAQYRDRFNLAGSPFSWSARFILSDSRAWITKFDNPDKVLSSHYEGEELGSIWGFVTNGFFASDEDIALSPDHTTVSAGFNGSRPYPGDIKYKDLNGDGKIDRGKSTLDDPGDRKIIGNTQARYPYSLDLNADWKGFDLRIFFQGIGRRQQYPGGDHDIVFWGQLSNNPWCSPNTKNLDNWGSIDDPHPDAYFPKVTQDPRIAYTPQTKYLQDASYLRLKNLTLGYTLPALLTSKWKIERLRLYLTGENMFTYHHIAVKGNDPESFNSNSTAIYPLQKVYSIGLNLTF